MKNNNKKASILLWAMILSIIISITFISISTKINQNIKLNENFKNFNEQENKINILKNTLTNSWISKNKIIIFENSNKKIIWLKKWEKKELLFEWDSNFNINIWIINWWALKFNYENNWTITSSWIINLTKTFTWILDNNNNTWSLQFENLWWSTKFIIESENSYNITNKKYKIIQKVWNIYLNEKKWVLE